LAIPMRTIINFAIAIALGAYLIRWGRQQRAAVAHATPAERRQARIVNVGLVGVTIGILLVFTWMTTDRYGPRWLHTWSLPLAVVTIVGGYLVSFLSSWMANRQ